VPDSTNGCTVIAPLLCVHHFRNGNHDDHHHDESDTSEKDTSDGDARTRTRIRTRIRTSHPRCLSDRAIVDVIDRETPRILPAIRKRLGLAKHAFLVPHDAHESLFATGMDSLTTNDNNNTDTDDNNNTNNNNNNNNGATDEPTVINSCLKREQFVTVCGGNILDDDHLGTLVRELSQVRTTTGNGTSTSTGTSRRQKRLGATVFFHQHVIAILQLPAAAVASRNRGDNNNNNNSKSPNDGEVWFDIIDSLPHKATLQRQTSTGAAATATDDRHSCATPTTNAAVGHQTANASPTSGNVNGIVNGSGNVNVNAVRMRCRDAAALTAALRWYACSVFSGKNARYIDARPWDETRTDVDPRVFQAFLWTDTD